jgi:glycosyltransferase involved in cell wall biosynthesis
MRILWFANTPSLAAEHLQTNGVVGGWIASLEKQLIKKSEIEMGVAFHFGYKAIDAFEINNTKYYPISQIREKGKVLGFKNRWMHRIESESVVEKYLEIIHEFKPDLIHIFGTENDFGLIIPLIKIPVVIQIQGNLTVCQKKWFSGISFIEILRYSHIKNVILGYGLFHQYFQFVKRAKREQTFFGNCKYFIGRTDWDRRITRVLSPSCTYFHCDEILREEFYAAQWNRIDNKKSILISTLSAATYKGLETILEAAVLLKQNKVDFEWQIAGISGNEEIIKIIEKGYKFRFSNNNIVFCGSVNATELLTLLLKANCYIHPSHIENSPNSVCEAMLVGMPIIATNAGGTSTLINNGIEGILIQDGDPHSLAGAIMELRENSEKLSKIGLEARKIAFQRHKPETIVTDLIEIYQFILSENGR